MAGDQLEDITLWVTEVNLMCVPILTVKNNSAIRVSNQFCSSLEPSFSSLELIFWDIEREVILSCKSWLLREFQKTRANLQGQMIRGSLENL